MFSITRWLLAAAASLMLFAGAASAQEYTPKAFNAAEFEKTFSHRKANVNGVRLHYVIGGTGKPLLLVHGWADTWYEWHRIMPALAQKNTVIAVDLRGMGESSRPQSGYGQKEHVEDLMQLMASLGYKSFNIVGHDIGAHVSFALATMHPEAVEKLALIDGTIPGIPPWEKLNIWHWAFYSQPDLPEALIAGKEEAFFTWFKMGFAVNTAPLIEDMPETVRAYSMPGAIRGGIGMFRARDDNAKLNIEWMKTNKLKMPVLAVGGDAGVGRTMIEQVKLVSENTTDVLLENTGHWVPQEQPKALIGALSKFLN
ncbi:MAG: alpha/beta hydrolase [Comamonadaceae bacterium]|nr:MAG: alpha/beta hydrolase [Comamonadaceae bacterium]